MFNNRLNSAGAMDNRPLDEKLTDTINTLMDTSLDLRNAITKRRTDEIWNLLAKQEEQAILLDEYFRLWNEISPKGDQASAEEQLWRKEIRQSIIQLRATQKSNAALAHSFLNAVRKAVESTGRKLATKKNTYNARGRRGKRSSVLINSIG